MKVTTEDLEILESSCRFTLREVCQRTGVSAEFVLELVDLGILEPMESASGRQDFDPGALLRLRCAQRLSHDLEVNLPGIAVSLDLMDEIRELRREVGYLRQALRRLRPEN